MQKTITCKIAETSKHQVEELKELQIITIDNKYKELLFNEGNLEKKIKEVENELYFNEMEEYYDKLSNYIQTKYLFLFLFIEPYHKFVGFQI